MLPFVGDAGEFHEEDHPRRDDGKFGSGGGGAEKQPNKPAAKTFKTKKTMPRIC